MLQPFGNCLEKKCLEICCFHLSEFHHSIRHGLLVLYTINNSSKPFPGFPKVLGMLSNLAEGQQLHYCEP
jgi:hypothetical protein